MKFIRSLAGIMAGLMLVASLVGQSADKLPPISVKEYKLKNGLTVLLHEDHTVPVVAVGTFYHVGSKNEAPGRTGFAHLFEHMMFQGSGNYVDGWRAVDELGGNVNGTTNEDRTWYELSRADALYGSRSHGQPPRRHGPGEARQPTRCR